MATTDDSPPVTPSGIPDDFATLRVGPSVSADIPADLATMPVANPDVSPTQAEWEAVSVMGANPDSPVPFVFGRRIAQGGMGAILEASDCRLGRTIAAKVMLTEAGCSDDQKQRFVQEAAILGRLEHPNIVPIHDLGRDSEGQLYYTMKLVKGETLQHILDRLRKEDAATLAHYTLDRLLTIFRKVCDALAFAHAQNIIHRDLKPENIMVGEFGEVLVMDWGISKILGEWGSGEASSVAPPQSPARPGPASFTATMDGAVMGTPNYMAPEQALGNVNELDERSDIFSLGGILYAILTLCPPVEGKDVWEILEKVQTAKITSPTLFGATAAKGKSRTRGKVLEATKITPLPHVPGGRVPPALSAVAMKALTLEKVNRYQHVAAFSADIEAYQSGFATSAENAGSWKQFTLLIKRNKAAALGILAVLVVGGTLGTQAFIAGRRAEHTLTDLRRTAPVFFAQAKIVLEEGALDDALEKIGYAIQLDDATADYHLFRANLQQSAQDLAPAAAGYRRVLALRHEDESSKLNLALCEKLLRESGGATLTLEQQHELLAAMRTQKRLVESAPLAALIDPNAETAMATLKARLREYQKQPGWGDGRIMPLPDGTFMVKLYRLAFSDLSILQGQPVSGLSLFDGNATDLSSLTGLPLKDLQIGRTQVSDLSPLRGMPLESLDMSETLVTDISPLRGMKLRTLKMNSSGVSDLSPLAGMPLTDLDCGESKSIADLAPLKGAPLISFQLRNASRVSSLAPLAGASLKRLQLLGIPVTDLSPLAQCPELEDLALILMPVTDLTPLTRLPITRLNCHNVKALDDLGPLRGMPLRFLQISGTSVTDLSPLADCPTLEELILPAGSLDLTPLRHLPNLRRLSTRSTGQAHSIIPAQTAGEFWKEYDAKPAGKK
ncbi:MAG: protein kinase [Verrucomicrobiales bacterium]|nr:protein kinase [Verrucomicrobiales bacterium]